MLIARTISKISQTCENDPSTLEDIEDIVTFQVDLIKFNE